MDASHLANIITQDLAPALPALTATGAAIKDGVLKGFSTDTYNYTKSLWAKLQPKIESKPAASEAVQDVANNCNDDDSRTALRHQIKKLLDEDPEVATALRELIQNHRPSGGSNQSDIVVACNESLSMNKSQNSGTIIICKNNKSLK